MIKNHSQQLSDYLESTGLSLDPTVPKVFFWGRSSGRTKGIHNESDTTGHFLNFLYTEVASSGILRSGYQSVFIGDKNQTLFDRHALDDALSSPQTVNMFKFWESPAFAVLKTATGLPSSVLQMLVFHKLDLDGHKTLHFSNRSGIIDQYAFILSPDRHRLVEFIPANFMGERLTRLDGKYIHVSQVPTPVSPLGRFLDVCVARVGDVHSRYPNSPYSKLDRMLRSPLEDRGTAIVETFQRLSRPGIRSQGSSRLVDSHEGFQTGTLAACISDLGNPLMNSVDSDTSEGPLPPTTPRGIFRQISSESTSSFQHYIRIHTNEFSKCL
jgi:hypothetical protein